MDKVQKIKEWISKTQDGLMDVNGNFEYLEHEGAYHILCNIDAYIDSLQEEPISEDLKTELNKYIKDHFTIDTEQLDRFGIEEKDYMYSMDKSDMLALVEHFTKWQKTKEELVSENLKEAMQHDCPDNIGIDDLLLWRNGFIAGAKWQKKQFEKDYTDLCNGIATAKGVAVAMAYNKGMADAREQMMAKAVDGVVHRFDGCGVASVHYNDPNGVPMAYFIPSEGLSAGDKVKIITIKKK